MEEETFKERGAQRNKRKENADRRKIQKRDKRKRLKAEKTVEGIRSVECKFH